MVDISNCTNKLKKKCWKIQLTSRTSFRHQSKQISSNIWHFMKTRLIINDRLIKLKKHNKIVNIFWIWWVTTVSSPVRVTIINRKCSPYWVGFFYPCKANKSVSVGLKKDLFFWAILVKKHKKIGEMIYFIFLTCT